MSQTATEPVFDVPRLLEQSEPRGAGARLGQAALVFLAVVVVSAWLSSRGPQAARLVNFFSGLIMILLMGAMAMISWGTYRRAREEQNRIEAIEELVRLRRWPEAGAMLSEMLSQPTRTHQSRIQALIFLTAVLARYNRFDDAIAVQDYLLQHAPLDGVTAHGLRLSRAMAMLREDHLFDADRAISELRRQVVRAGRANSEAQGAENESADVEPPPQSLSAGLALIELYRDVKTGHPREAIELFRETLPAMRDQLGHRVADAYALVARAYDLLDQAEEARSRYEKATLLAPMTELHRRYPETAALAQKYAPARAPAEVA